MYQIFIPIVDDVGHEVHHGAAGIITSNFEAYENHLAFLVAFLKYGANSGKLRPRRTRDVNSGAMKEKPQVSSNNNPLTR